MIHKNIQGLLKKTRSEGVSSFVDRWLTVQDRSKGVLGGNRLVPSSGTTAPWPGPKLAGEVRRLLVSEHRFKKEKTPG